MKKLAIILVLLCALFLAACQPTPEVAPVVNKRESEEALKQSSEYAAPGDTANAVAIEQSINATPMEYEVAERWKDEIVKDEKFKVQADIDVMMPKLKSIPIQKLVRRDFTQEDIDGFIKYFVGDKDVKFYNWPPPQTKADFEAELINIKQALSVSEAGGDGEDPEFLKQRIAEVEAKLKAAPEKPEIEYIDPVFTYQRDYETGKPYKKLGENYMSLAYDDSATGGLRSIYASKYDEGKSMNNSFSFSSCNSDVEYYYDYTKEYLSQEEQRLSQIEDEKIRAEQKKFYDDERKRYDESMAGFAANNMDIEKGRQKAIEVLEDLGISGVQITQSCKAMVEPMNKSMWGSSNNEWKQPTGNGLYYGFTRASGSLPCDTNYSGMYYDADEQPENTYAPPFYMENGSITFDADFNVVDFRWSDPAIATEIITENAELLPFSQVAGRAADQLFYDNTYYYDDEYKYEDSTMKLRFEATEVKLVSAYINAKDDLNAALIVPAWKISFQGYYTDDHPEYGTKGKEVLNNTADITVSAIDGSVILPAMMNQLDEDMYSLEYEPGETPEPKPTDAPAMEAPVAG